MTRDPARDPYIRRLTGLQVFQHKAESPRPHMEGPALDGVPSGTFSSLRQGIGELIG